MGWDRRRAVMAQLPPRVEVHKRSISADSGAVAVIFGGPFGRPAEKRLRIERRKPKMASGNLLHNSGNDYFKWENQLYKRAIFHCRV